ncbi:MAG: peptidoglycan DD-metalloendopeptidase family protein [Pseudomonadota bacterium]
MKLALLTCLGLCLAASSLADTASEARQRLLAAAGILEAAETARDRVDALTDAIQAYEVGLAAMRAELRRLTLQERELLADLADEDGAIGNLLALMQNATEQTETQSLLHPGSAVDTIRAGNLASLLIPSLQARAERLQSQLATLDEVQAVLKTAEASMAEGLAGVEQARAALGAALTERTDLPPRLATNIAAMTALVNSAETLSVLADSLLSEDRRSDAPSDAAWVLPLTGRILTGFSEKSGHPGWSVSTFPRALLASPRDATIRFSGGFPGRGDVIILEADGPTLVVLAGLSTRFVEVGQVVAAGDPLGLVGRGQSAAQDNLNVSGGDVSLNSNVTLYIEIRQDGAPVDPGTLLTLKQEQG